MGSAPPVSAGTPYSLIDTVAHLTAAPIPTLAGAQDITVSDDLTVAQLTTIQSAANPAATINYNLADTAAGLAGASAATLSGATTIDATNDAVTLTDAQVTDAIIAKFDATDNLTLNAAGATLSGLSAAALGNSDVVTLNATDNAVTLTAAKFNALDTGGGLIDVTDAVTITTDATTDNFDLNGAGGAGMFVVFAEVGDGVTINHIANFNGATDTLQFPKLVFNADGLPTAGAPIDGNQLLLAADVTADGGTGFATTNHFLYDTDGGQLFYDADGSGAGVAVQIAVLPDHPVLTANDFVMIA